MSGAVWGKNLQNNLEYEFNREGQFCYLESEPYAKLGFEGMLWMSALEFEFRVSKNHNHSYFYPYET